MIVPTLRVNDHRLMRILYRIKMIQRPIHRQLRQIIGKFSTRF